tara:strand:- start:1807 stop:2268 length:462 start_codon:yes stop_codon:yes gene_type:complete
MPSYQVRLISSLQPQVYKDTANNGTDAGFNGDGWYLDDDAPYKMRGEVVHTFTGNYSIYKPNEEVITINPGSPSQYLPDSQNSDNPAEVIMIKNLGEATLYVSIDAGVRFPFMIKKNESWGCRIIDPQTVTIKTLETLGGLVGKAGVFLAYIP